MKIRMFLKCEKKMNLFCKQTTSSVISNEFFFVNIYRCQDYFFSVKHLRCFKTLLYLYPQEPTYEKVTVHEKGRFHRFLRRTAIGDVAVGGGEEREKK